MVINGGSRSGWRFFARHLMNAEANERVRVADIRGVAAKTCREALREMDFLASGSRVKNGLYHANLNPRADEHLTSAQWEQATDLLEKNLGLDGQPRIVVEHVKDGRTHRHVVWSRIDAGKMTARPDGHNYARHEQTARELERLFGHARVQGAHVERGGKRPARRPQSWESFRGQGSGLTPQQVTAELTGLWNAAETGAAFKAALEERGYILARGDRRDFCVIDQAGHEHSLARRIEGAKAADIRARMSDLDREALLSVAEARELARNRPTASGGTGGMASGRLTGWTPEPVRAPAGRVTPWGDDWRPFADRMRRGIDAACELSENGGTAKHGWAQLVARASAAHDQAPAREPDQGWCERSDRTRRNGTAAAMG